MIRDGGWMTRRFAWHHQDIIATAAPIGSHRNHVDRIPAYRPNGGWVKSEVEPYEPKSQTLDTRLTALGGDYDDG